MSRELTDTEARDHYRDELNRTRTAIKALAEQLEDSSEATGWSAAEDLYRILGERP